MENLELDLKGNDRKSKKRVYSVPQFCRTCGVRIGKWKRFCEECREAKRLHKLSLGTVTECSMCGSRFKSKHGTKVCSVECREKRARERKETDRMRSKAKTKEKERKCRRCGKVHRRKSQQFCSADCRSAHLNEVRRAIWRKKFNENPEKYRAKSRARYVKGGESLRTKVNSRRRERRQRDPVYALSERVRCRTKGAFRARGMNKKSATMQMIGCDWETLKKHIETQFRDGMSWRNREQWDVDHIVPLASAKSEPELLRLAHFSNLRPMWAEENRSKGDRIVTCQPELTLNLANERTA